jgi:8-oxo-dGTP pyrophosphatase MutT (NUDIX family)
VSFLDRVRECNAHDFAKFLPFFVDGIRVGWIGQGFARRLAQFGDVFDIASDSVSMAARLSTPAARTAAMAEIVAALAAEGRVTGVRGELYPVSTSFAANPLLQMERAAVPLFGVRAYGIHVNGYVRRGAETLMWVAERAADKQTFPGQLDQIVAGGQPVGLGLAENLVKECAEEASIPASLAAKAVPVGAVTYCCEVDEGLRPDVLFCYDLELPESFEPKNSDGEVAAFHLWPMERVMHVVASTREFKFNCNLVAIDFFIRHGFLGPEHPDYLALLHALHP